MQFLIIYCVIRPDNPAVPPLSLDDDAPESVLHGATTFTLCTEADADCSISDVPVVPSTVVMVILVRSPKG